MSFLKRYAVAGLCLAAVSVPTAAIASGGNSGNFARPLANSDGSAELRGGTWRFDSWPPATTIPGFYYYGNLKDTKADGDWVYTRGKVDGFGWAGGASAENHNGQDAPAVAIGQRITGYDPPGQGKIQVCRHRTGVLPNICTESSWKYSD